ncbi:MAG TPA: hypothetical protein VI451_09715, partial [Anaerolineales bacterium]|nr:hypothetical protein [Anaerolineales bacterium]
TVIQYGLIGGLITLYLSAVGMVETFSARNLIGTFFSMGDVMVFAGAFGAGIVLGRKYHALAMNVRLLAGLVAGVMASVPLIFIILMTQVVNFRAVFVHISPPLIEELTFGSGVSLGSVILLVVSAILGLLGAGIDLLPDRLQRALTNGSTWTLVIGLFSENVGQIITSSLTFILRGQLGPSLGRSLNLFLFQNKSLTLPATVMIFLLVFAIFYMQAGKKARERFEQLSPSAQRNRRIAGLIFLGLIVILLPQLVGTFLSQVVFLVGMFAIMGLGLNIVVGYAGLLDLGYVAFFAFGAYTMALLTTRDANLMIGGGNFNFFTALPIAVLMGVLFGTLLGFPVLRLRGDYLAIVTLGFGEIIRILALSDWLKPLEGGAQGVLKIPAPAIGPLVLNGPEMMYYPIIVGGLIAAFVSIRLRTSRLGRQWMAMREDEDVAEAMGINLIQTKLLAFAIGAGFSALAGALFAARLGTIFPHSFGLLYSLNALSLIIVGGMGSIPGVLVGSFILVGMPELLREFAEYRLLMYGILLIVMMLVKPEGFLPEEVHKRELHADEEFAQVAAD